MLIADPALNRLTGEILGAAIEVHRSLGPGLMESAYAPCLRYELAARKIPFLSESPVPLVYKGIRVAGHYRADLIVSGAVIVEIKAVDVLAAIHESQVLTYLKLTGCPAGLLINFNVSRLMDGVKRLINPRMQAGKWRAREP